MQFKMFAGTKVSGIHRSFRCSILHQHAFMFVSAITNKCVAGANSFTGYYGNAFSQLSLWGNLMPKSNWYFKGLWLSIVMVIMCLSSTCQASAFNAAAAASKGASGSEDVRNWFEQYDSIRRNAEMSKSEKLESAHLLCKSFKPDPSSTDRSQARSIISRMVARYRTAVASISRLKPLPQTRALQQGYKRYFTGAYQLFNQYLKMQNSVANGDRSAAGPLLERKNALEELDKRNKQLDKQLRKQYEIPEHA